MKPSIDEIQAAYRAIMDMCPTYGHGDSELHANDHIATDAIKELAALRAWRIEATKVLAALAYEAEQVQIAYPNDRFWRRKFTWIQKQITPLLESEANHG